MKVKKLTIRPKTFLYLKTVYFGSFFFFTDQVLNTFVLMNSDINTSVVTMALKKIANFVKISNCSNYKQSTITDYFSKKS